MRFRGLDLNLLHAFDILLQERSVSRAARRLHLSQPAVSAALARLRDYFRDDLLVADGKRMFPTALAETLVPQVKAALHAVETILDTSSAFDPATANRSFRIIASDYILMVLLKPLVERLGTIAPGIRIIAELPGEHTPSRLADGKIDLLITPEEYASPLHPVDDLFEERHVVVGWDRNPAMAQAITERAFFELEHVGVVVGTGAGASVADRQLEHLGKPRNIAITVPDFASVAWMICGTERIGLMHERLARAMAPFLPLTIAPVPFAFPPMREVMQSHRSRQADPGLLWLKASLAECAARV